MNGPSRRSLSVTHFLVMEILERAHALEAEGRDIVHMEVGEPDFPTPPAAVEAGVSAIRAGRTHYTHSLGIHPLRQRIATMFDEDYGVELDPARILITAGSSAAILLAFAALLDPGDEVAVTDPGYPCYPNIARALGAVPRAVPVEAADGFAYNPARLAAAVGSRTKAIVVNSPANPTGTITPPAVLEQIAGLGVPVVSDEIYHGLVYEGSAETMLRFRDDAWVVSGFSKRFAMTGWRLGFLVVPTPHLRSVQALQQNLFISASDFGQWAAASVMDEHDALEEMRRKFDERRHFLLDALPRIGLPVPARPQGAFYVFADASHYGKDSLRLALDILENADVAVTPGIDFGAGGEGYLRFSYATSLDRLEEGVRRLGAYLR